MRPSPPTGVRVATPSPPPLHGCTLGYAIVPGFAGNCPPGCAVEDDHVGGGPLTHGIGCDLSGGCHAKFENMHFNKNQNFPHLVSMAGKVVTVTQMINYCLVNPMAGSALEADSDDMTAMSAFLRAYRMRYRQAARAYRQNRRR